MSEIIRPDWPAPGNVVAGTTTLNVAEGDIPTELRFLNQVHGANVVSAAVVREASQALDADAVTGSYAGDYCAVRTADCLPLLLCADDGSEIAAAHGGWRGVLAGVIENTIAALKTDPADLMAWLGPGISQPAFEVGDEVRQGFVGNDPRSAACFERNELGRWQADLYGLARLRLANCGVSAIYGAEWCTFGDPERFHSYRRDPDCGRMVTFIGITSS